MAREGKAPAFQFYASDWLADEDVRAMNLAERGAYIDLLAFAWREGSAPDDSEKCARLLGARSREMASVWPSVRARFVVRTDGRLVSTRMEAQRDEYNRYRAAQQQKGNASAAARAAAREQRSSSGATAVDFRFNSASASASASERETPPASPPALSLDASPPKKRERPKAPPLPFTAAQALEAVSQAAGSAFTRPAGQLPKGQVIALQAHVRAFPELASWTALGRYLAAGRASHLRDPGPSWLASANLPEVMTRALAWESSGRPAATPAAKFATPVITGRVIPTIAETEAMIARQREDAKNAVAPPKEFLEMARRLTADIEEA